MKSLLTILFFVSSFFGLLSEETVNKHKVSVSPNFGLNLNGSDFKNLGGLETCCPGFTSGFGTGINFGAGYSYLIKNDTWLYFGLDYSKLNANFIELENEAINIDGENRLDATIEQKVISELSSFGLNLGASFELLKSIEAYIGYRLGLPSDLSYEQTEILKEPYDAVFQETQSRIRNEAKGIIANHIYHSVVGKIGYKLPISSGTTTYIVPNVGFNLGLNSLNDEMGLTSNSINFGVDLAYNFSLNSADEHKAEPIPAIEKTQNVAPIDIALAETDNKESQSLIVRPVTIGGDKKVQKINQIVLDQVKSTQMVPLLNYIFFEEDSSSLPLRYRVLKKEGAQAFNSQNLFGENTIEIYHHLLNVIGERMKSNPQSVLKIVGTKSEIEDKTDALAIARAKTVRDYLSSTWGISSDRLKISSIDAPYIPSKGTGKESLEENQRVELYSDDDILKPLVLKDTLYIPITKEITFYTVVDTNIKVEGWHIDITNSDGEDVFETNGRYAPPLTTSFKIDEAIAQKIEDSDELLYRFELNTEDGERQVVTGRFPVVINTLSQKESQNLADSRIDKYSLILFDYDKYELDKKNLDIIGYIKSNITSETKLIISGYSDIIGEAEYNKELSEKRTESVYSQFPENQNKEEFHYGESILLFNNNIPEGRFYSRTVLIKAITPIRK